MRKVSLGKITSPFGLYGAFKCNLYSNPPRWKVGYLALETVCKIELVKWPYAANDNCCLCKTQRVTNRSEVAQLIDKEIWIPREELPTLDEGEFYFYDLIGLPVVLENTTIGCLRYVYDFGAGTILRLDGDIYIHWVSVDTVEEHQIRLKDGTVIN